MTAPLYTNDEFEQAKKKIEEILEGNEDSHTLRDEILGPPPKKMGLCSQFDYLIQYCIINDEFYLVLKYGTAAEQHAALAEVGLTDRDLIKLTEEFPVIKTDFHPDKIKIPEPFGIWSGIVSGDAEI